eukprot:PRCOL_00006773-RA
MWYPAAGESAAAGASPVLYPHAISVAKIARVLLSLPPSTPRWLDRDVPLRAAAGVVAGGRRPAGADVKGAVILCHGYLGSRFDLVDYAEALAAAGFVVCAPEFAEGLADPTTTPPYARPGAPPPQNPSASREEVVNATLAQLVEGPFGITRDSGRLALVGQSAGAGTAVQTRGRLARVAIAGLRDVPAEVAADPLLVIASEGDGVISLDARESGRFGPSPGIVEAVNALPVPVAAFDGDSLRELTESAAAAAASGAAAAATTAGGGECAPAPGGGAKSGAAVAAVAVSGGAEQACAPPVDRTAFVAYRGEGSPCHISFLSARTNDAMVDVLSPLLPLAEALDVPLLDFDVYSNSRDSDEVAADCVPLVTNWLSAVVG